MTGIVLLTGATGFIGRQILRQLSGKHFKVRVVIREGKQHQLPYGANIESIISTPDLFAENAAWWSKTCEEVDTIIHAAWYAEPGQYLQSPQNLDCLIGTIQMAKGAVKAKIRRFVGLGTCFEYDLVQGVLSTNTPLRPTTLYAGSKVGVFTTLSHLLPQNKIEFAWCRIFYLYGEGEHPNRLIPYLRSQLNAGLPAELTDGTQVRDFLDVKDAAIAIVNAALSDIQGPINICSGIPITVRQLAEKIADEHGRPELLKFGARANNLTDPPCVIGIRN